MSEKFALLAWDELSSGINDSVTTMTITTPSRFPAISGSDYFHLVISLDGASAKDLTVADVEVVKVTGITGNDLTIVRGESGTTAKSWVSGSRVSLSPLHGMYNDVASYLIVPTLAPTTVGTDAIDIQSLRTDGNNSAKGVMSIAIGVDVETTDYYGVAIGRNTTATSSSTIAVGNTVNTIGSFAVAIGSTITASGSSVAIGKSVTASVSAVAIGASSSASQTGATAVGFQAVASGIGLTTAIGNSVTASGQNSTVLGGNADGTAIYAVGVGYNAGATNSGAVALGADTTSSGVNSTSIGYTTSCTASYATAVGGGNNNVPNSIMVTTSPVVQKALTGNSGNETRFYGGSSTIIGSEEIDLLQTAADNVVSVDIPANSHFFPTKCWYVLTSVTGTVTTQPQLSFGLGVSTEALVAQVATTKSSSYGSEIYDSLTNDGTTSDLTVSLKVSAVGATTMKARFFFEGLLVQDQ